MSGIVHRRKFAFLYAVLILAAGVGLGAAIAIATRPAPPKPPPWSDWHPTAGSAGTVASQIAQHVSALYRAPDGTQLTVVRGLPQLSYSSQAVTLLLQDPKAQQGYRQLSGQTAEFDVCGAARSGDCSIPASAASAGAAGALTRREALELALTALHYMPTVQNVVVLLPSVVPKATSRVLTVTRQNVGSLLRKPLDNVLPGQAKKVSRLDAQKIAIKTDNFLYHYQLAKLQDGSYAFVIDPVSAEKAPSGSTKTA